MIIGEKKIKEIRETFRLRYNAFIYRMAGPEVLTKEEIQELIDKGLIKVDDPRQGLVTDAYSVTRLRNDLPHADRPKMSLKEFREDLPRVLPPLTAREQYAVQHIRQSAGDYLKKLRDTALASVVGTVRAWNYDERNRLLTDIVRPTIEGGLEDTKVTVNTLASRLREKTGDLHRDWLRTAKTELSNALNLGAADSIIARNREKGTDEIQVYKIAHLDAALCPYCRKFYVETDGITPKVYTMTELMANGSNFGRKAPDWKPTIGATHPNERCELVELPKGFGFEPGSNRSTFMGEDYTHTRSQ